MTARGAQGADQQQSPAVLLPGVRPPPVAASDRPAVPGRGRAPRPGSRSAAVPPPALSGPRPCAPRRWPPAPRSAAPPCRCPPALELGQGRTDQGAGDRHGRGGVRQGDAPGGGGGGLGTAVPFRSRLSCFQQPEMRTADPARGAGRAPRGTFGPAHRSAYPGQRPVSLDHSHVAALLTRRDAAGSPQQAVIGTVYRALVTAVTDE